ncbi:MAG: hypothetical protein ACLUKN_12340 [Bacilli bacterium]
MAKDIVVNAADFGLNEQAENCATIINNAIAHCKRSGRQAGSAKGKYKIYQEEGIVFDSFPTSRSTAADPRSCSAG